MKNRIKQIIYLRGSCDFATVADYQAVIDKAIAGLNRQCEAKFEEEKSNSATAAQSGEWLTMKCLALR